MLDIVRLIRKYKKGYFIFQLYKLGNSIGIDYVSTEPLSAHKFNELVKDMKKDGFMFSEIWYSYGAYKINFVERSAFIGVD